MPVVNCTFCGSTVHRKPARLSRNTNNFCSRDCYASHQRVSHIDCNGYRRFKMAGKQFLEHRFIIEKVLGRKLGTSEHVHHINGDRLDNRLSNLRVMEGGEHTAHHRRLSFDIEAAKALRTKGLSCSEIGNRLGVSEFTIRDRFTKEGIDTSRIHTADRNAVRELFLSGQSGADISRLLGFGKSTINRIISSLGLRC
ncbi:MAG TPA: hypothetical protein ENK38_01340 [Gammaproteobacteria bacterium]|nr:hypothetical protein [Gammaproteobacteria bacterium]